MPQSAIIILAILKGWDIMADTTNTNNGGVSATGNQMSGKSIYLHSDDIEGGKTHEMESLKRIQAVLDQGGMITTLGSVGPGGEGACYGSGKDFGLFLVGGQGIDTYISVYRDYKPGGTFIIMGLQQWGGSGNYAKQGTSWISTGKEWDAGGFETKSIHDEAQQWNGQPIGNFFKAHQDAIGVVQGKSPEEMAQNILSGNFTGGGSSGGSGVQIVEGFMTSNRGDSPQVFTPENYEQLTEIPWSSVSVSEEDYEVKTAEFTTHEKIDLTSGRVYVLIQGDPGSFGGIIIKREYDAQSRMYTYTCQEYMARVLSNTIYAIYNKSKTVYDWIKEILDDIGVPDAGLGELEDYAHAVDQQYLDEVKSEETANNNADADGSTSTPNTNTTPTDATNNTNGNTDSNSTPGADSPTTTGTNTNSNDAVVENPFEKKPKGIYDKQTILDHFRTLIFDYGVHVRLYGDVTGIPIFKAYEKDEWMNKGWYLQKELGYQTDYHTSFDITNVVTQVGVKNIEALKPTGELYTSEDLLGDNLAQYFGRMGTIVDNPTPQGGTSATTSANQEEYQDKDGNKYTADQVFSTNGKPSCNNDAKYNNGTKPEYKTYEKYWVNKCASCGKEKTMKSEAPGSSKGGEEGKSICEGGTSTTSTTSSSTTTNTSNTNSTNSTSSDNSTEGCGAKYCQFCGANLNGGDSLTEVFKVTNTSSTSGTGTDSTSTSDSNSTNNTNSTNT